MTRNFGRRRIRGAAAAGVFLALAACGGEYTRVEEERPGEEEPLPPIVPDRRNPTGAGVETERDPGQEDADSVAPVTGGR